MQVFTGEIGCVPGPVPGCAALAAMPWISRKAGSGDQREAYPGVIVNYDAIHDAAGHRLRFIVTHPQHSETGSGDLRGRWLSCDTVEAPPGASVRHSECFSLWPYCRASRRAP